MQRENFIHSDSGFKIFSKHIIHGWGRLGGAVTHVSVFLFSDRGLCVFHRDQPSFCWFQESLSNPFYLTVLSWFTPVYSLIVLSIEGTCICKPLMEGRFRLWSNWFNQGVFSHSFNHPFIFPTNTLDALYVRGLGEPVANSMTRSALENRRNRTIRRGQLSSPRIYFWAWGLRF